MIIIWVSKIILYSNIFPALFLTVAFLVFFASIIMVTFCACVLFLSVFDKLYNLDQLVIMKYIYGLSISGKSILDFFYIEQEFLL